VTPPAPPTPTTPPFRQQQQPQAQATAAAPSNQTASSTEWREAAASGASASPTYAFSPAPASAGSKQQKAALPKLGNSRKRFANRGAKRSETVISFRLSRSARVALRVNGPGPSCELAGRVPIAGKKGRNQVLFDGTVQKVHRESFGSVTLETVRQVRLEPGTYLVELTSRAGKRRLARTFVTIVDPQSPHARYALPQCSSHGVALNTWLTGSALAAADGSVATVQSVSGAGSSPGEDGGGSEVLGGVSPKLDQGEPEAGGFPFPEATAAGGFSFFETVLFAVVLGSLFGLAVAVFGSRRS
jgi:hypothetical protein